MFSLTPSEQKRKDIMFCISLIFHYFMSLGDFAIGNVNANRNWFVSTDKC